jgi:hypothetical protein
LTALVTEKHQLGDLVSVPDLYQEIFVNIEVKPTIWGALATLLYKPSPLQIRLVLNDGSQRQYRFIANMAKSDFLLSPLIENTVEFAMLYDKERSLGSKRVKSFSISTYQGASKQWCQDYVVHFSGIMPS